MDPNLTTHKVNRDSTQNQNLHGRRITGAGASQGPNDYVTRKELDNAVVKVIPGIPSRPIGSFSSSNGQVYNLIKSGILAIQSDVAPNLILAEGGQPSYVNVTLKNAPVGSVFTVNIYTSTSLTTPWMTLTILANTTSIQATNTQLVAALPFTSYTYLRVDVIAVGSIYPGSDLLVTIIC